MILSKFYKWCFIALLGLFSLIFLVAYTLPVEDPASKIPADIRLLLEKAEELRLIAKYSKAIDCLGKAQDLYRKKGNELEALKLYDKILWVAIDTDFDEKALLKRCEKAEKEIKAKLKEYPALEAILYLAEIQKRWVDEDAELAKQNYADLQKVLQKYPNWDYAAAGATYMSCVHAYITGDFDACLPLVELADKLIQENTKDGKAPNAYLYSLRPYYEFYANDNLSICLYYVKNDYDAALSAYEGTLDILKSNKIIDSLRYCKALNSIGELYTHKSEHDKAIEYYETALEYVASDAIETFASCYQTLGDSYNYQGKTTESIAYLRKSIAYYKQIKNPSKSILLELIDVYRTIATVYVKTKEFDLSKENLSEIAKFPKGLDNKASWTYATWGFLYEHTKEYDKAIAAHEKSIIAYKEEGRKPSSAYWNLGKIAYAQKDYKLATQYFHRGIAEDVPGISADDFTQNPHFDSIAYKDNELTSITPKLKSYYAYVNTNNLWDEHGKQVLELANLAVQCFEYLYNSYERESSKGALLGDAYSTYEQAISIYLYLYEQTKDKKYLTKAVEFTEKSKSVLLEDALQEDNAMSFGGIPDSLIALEEGLKQEIIAAEKELHLAQKSGDEKSSTIHKKTLIELRQKVDRLKRTFEKSYPKYYELKYSKTPISITKIQSQLPDSVAIVEYFEGEEHLFVFGITNKEILYLHLPINEDYSANLQILRESMSNAKTADRDDYSRLAYQFYQNNLEKVLPKNVKRLIIIPDGMLNYIAFEALLMEQPTYNKEQKIDFDKLPYLMNQYTISYNYSAAIWAQQDAKMSKSTNHQILAMAATYNKANDGLNKLKNNDLKVLRKSLSPIPGTLQEIELLQKNYSGVFYTDKEANELNFKEVAPDYGILHLAMHGIVDNEHSNFSSLAFTEDGAGMEDNFLHANEIKQLNLNADLVVLSACETGFGKYQHGEGVISLGRSFMYAGVPSMVMTLWEINDYSSVYIVQSFYENLQKGMDKDIALQKAKQTYLHNAKDVAAHPAFWAAFVQVGDYKPMKVASNSSNWIWYLGGGLLVAGLLFFTIKNKNKNV